MRSHQRQLLPPYQQQHRRLSTPVLPSISGESHLSPYPVSCSGDALSHRTAIDQAGEFFGAHVRGGQRFAQCVDARPQLARGDAGLAQLVHEIAQAVEVHRDFRVRLLAGGPFAE